MIDEFLAKQALMFADTKELLRTLSSDDVNDEGTIGAAETRLDSIRADFFEMVDESWHAVMDMEIQLYENVEDANVQFGLVITEMLNEFIEQSQTMFVQMRDAEGNFSDALFEIVSRFIAQKSSAGDVEAIPEELREVRRVKIFAVVQHKHFECLCFSASRIRMRL